MQRLVSDVEKELRCVETSAAATWQQLADRSAEAERCIADAADLKPQLDQAPSL
jgi:hypothetical protein